MADDRDETIEKIQRELLAFIRSKIAHTQDSAEYIKLLKMVHQAQIAFPDIVITLQRLIDDTIKYDSKRDQDVTEQVLTQNKLLVSQAVQLQKAEEEVRKAEELRKAEEEARKAKEKQKAEEEARKAEELRKAEEEARKAKEGRKSEQGGGTGREAVLRSGSASSETARYDTALDMVVENALRLETLSNARFNIIAEHIRDNVEGNARRYRDADPNIHSITLEAEDVKIALSKVLPPSTFLTVANFTDIKDTCTAALKEHRQNIKDMNEMGLKDREQQRMAINFRNQLPVDHLCPLATVVDCINDANKKNIPVSQGNLPTMIQNYIDIKHETASQFKNERLTPTQAQLATIFAMSDKDKETHEIANAAKDLAREASAQIRNLVPLMGPKIEEDKEAKAKEAAKALEQKIEQDKIEAANASSKRNKPRPDQ